MHIIHVICFLLQPWDKQMAVYRDGSMNIQNKVTKGTLPLPWTEEIVNGCPTSGINFLALFSGKQNNCANYGRKKLCQHQVVFHSWGLLMQVHVWGFILLYHYLKLACSLVYQSQWAMTWTYIWGFGDSYTSLMNIVIRMHSGELCKEGRLVFCVTLC